jgi:broad specificity phosphatase PhoE
MRYSSTMYLVRHGEVANPDHVVYASLPGFGLSGLGREQAAQAAARLASRQISAVIASPLERAAETAAILAGGLGVTVDYDDRLVEWELGERWAGTPWDLLDERFPGELAAYLEHPHDLAFTPEPLAALAGRVANVLADAAARAPGERVVVVSHQDPIQAARLVLTGRPLHDLQAQKPGHCSIVTLAGPDGDAAWSEKGYWEPDQGHAFPPIAPGDA